MDINEILDKIDVDEIDWNKIPPGFFCPKTQAELDKRNVSKYMQLSTFWELSGREEKEAEEQNRIVDKTGNYRELKSFQNAEIVFDLTVEFIKKFVSYKSRTRDQMEQAARSCKQNIVEGSMASRTSRRTEIKLTSVARASLDELLNDYEDYLRVNNSEKWDINHPRAKEVRSLAYKTARMNRTYATYLRDGLLAANMLICLIHQTNYLLDRQLRAQEQDYKRKGGFQDRIDTDRRRQARRRTWTKF